MSPATSARHPDPAVPPLVERIRVASCLLLLWAVAFAQAPGKIVADTKIDLALNPLGLMGRSLHLWDPTTTFGVLQNQAYGYLFPMGPFAALGNAVLPAWVTQRLWWCVLLSVGYLSMRALLRALDVGDPLTRHAAALAYALAPRVLSTLGPISSEAAPALLAPAVLLPMVLASRGRISAARGATLSGVAVLACGGVNATATLMAVVPTGLWMITRSRWWRSPLTLWWGASVGCATLWWFLPLVLLGRYSPPFLDWIESAESVSRQVTLLDAVRGTDHWIAHLVTVGGPWWNAGHRLVTEPLLIIVTGVVAGLGLAGLASRRLPERRFLILTAVVGVVLIALPHSGTLASPWAAPTQALLDGPLAPLRNVHKADPILRLALAVGLGQALSRLRGAARRSAVPRRRVLAAAGVYAVVATLLVSALPGLSGDLPSRGAFQEVPEAWRDAGRYLDAHPTAGSVLLVPASNFGEYTWGRPLDEVLRSQTRASFAVRDAVPLTPANTTRLLDAIELRLQSGRDVGGAVAALARAGVGRLVLRNDLDTRATGGIGVDVIRAALEATPGLVLERGFGRTGVNASGQRLRPVEIWSVAGAVGPVQSWPLSSAVLASGASESLPALADAGLLKGPVVFEGDATVAGPVTGRALDSAPRIVTDSYRARGRSFGAVRGRDVTQTLTADAEAGARDYWPWSRPGLRTTVAYDGLDGLWASSSLASSPGLADLDPSLRPFAAVDGDSTTAWVAYADGAPTLRLTFPEARSVDGLEISPLADRGRFGEFLGVPRRIEVVTDRGSTLHTLSGGGEAQRVPTAPGTTRTLTVRILSTDGGREVTVTGLSSVRVPGLVVRETALAPGGLTAPAAAYVLGRAAGAHDGCIRVFDRYRCSSATRAAEDVVSLDRTLPMTGSAAYSASGTLAATGGPATEDLLDAGASVQVSASSRRSRAPEGRPAVVLDGDPATAWSPAPQDREPLLSLKAPRPVTVRQIHLDIRDEWLDGLEPTVQVTVDGRRHLARLQRDGSISVPPMRGRTIGIRLLVGPAESDSLASLEVAEVSIPGLEQPAPDPAVRAACGSGPRLLVDGRTVPTKVTGRRDAAFGESRLAWEACERVSLRSPSARVVVEQWRGFTADLAVLACQHGCPAAGGSAGEARPVTARAQGPAQLSLAVGAGSASVVALAQNANAGWQATMGGRRLESIVVDGWRQGFVVPEGAAGTVVVAFGPDRSYRAGLLVGLALVVLLLAGAVLARVRGGRPVVLRAATGWTWTGPVLAAGLGVILAGAAGAAVALLAIALERWLGRRPWGLSGTVAALVLGAAALQALASPGRVGGPFVEGLVRLSCLAAFCLVTASLASRRGLGPSGAPRRTGG